MTSSAPTPLRLLIENRLSQLTAETEMLFSEARERARREMAEQLNQAARRIRQSAGIDELCATLADAAGQFATCAILFRIEGDRAQAAQGELSLAGAPALHSAIETRDPVIAAATASEVSAPLLEWLGQPADGRVCIFPVLVRNEIPALLCVAGGVEGSSIELLSQVAAAAWSSLAPPPARDLIAISPALAAQPLASAPVEKTPASAWDQLSAEEQQVHLRAQRSARVKVAEMRLFSPEAVHSGRERRDLYDALRQPIDTARESFHTQYFAACPSMVDYLHLELLRTLANDDPELLGKNYPGPMV